MKKWTHRLTRVGWLFFLFWAGSIGTAEAPPGKGMPPAVWDILGPEGRQPDWFGPVTSQAGWKTYSWKAPLRPPAGGSRLALTLVFRETPGGFARVIWQEAGKSVTLCENLYEEAAHFHQRTFLVDRSTIGGPGQLIVESTGSEPALERVELRWVEPLVLAGGWASWPGFYLSPSGKICPIDELLDGGPLAPLDVERGSVMDAVLDAGPVKLVPQQPVRFLAPIGGRPFYARFEAEAAGLNPGEEPWLWVNGKALSGVAVESPGLDDPGYRPEKGGTAILYGGWRKIWAFVPAGFLQGGENQLDVQLANGFSFATLRNIRLQVVFAREEMRVPPRAQVPTRLARTLPAQFSWGSRLRTGLSSGKPVVGLRQE